MMRKMQVPEIEQPSAEDWEYYSSFGSIQKYFHETELLLENENRFFVDQRFLKLLGWYANQKEIQTTVDRQLPAMGKLYRARRYDEDIAQEDRNMIQGDTAFRGYGPEESFVPPRGTTVGDGRGNPKGIVYLYVSSDIKTAIAEINPLRNDTISVAVIEPQKNLAILNLANLYASTCGADDKFTQFKRDVPIELTRIFNTPQHDPNKYLLCQYVSEYIKILGYDGIRFASSKTETDWIQGTGMNFIIFNYDKCKAISSDLFYVSDIKIDIKKNIAGFYSVFEE